MKGVGKIGTEPIPFKATFHAVMIFDRRVLGLQKMLYELIHALSWDFVACPQYPFRFE